LDTFGRTVLNSFFDHFSDPANLRSRCGSVRGRPVLNSHFSPGLAPQVGQRTARACSFFDFMGTQCTVCPPVKWSILTTSEVHFRETLAKDFRAIKSRVVYFGSTHRALRFSLVSYLAQTRKPAPVILGDRLSVSTEPRNWIAALAVTSQGRFLIRSLRRPHPANQCWFESVLVRIRVRPNRCSSFRVHAVKPGGGTRFWP